jgi:basic amino acid/polyamine antiporter, APA family
MKFLRKKPIATVASGTRSGGGELQRSLGAFQLMNIGIGATIGAGIFVVTGTAAAAYAGPAIVISFLLAGAACLCAALCYAEFASLVPVSGGAYSYAYATLGEGVAWLIGWALVLEYLVSAATVAVGWSGYFVAFLEGVGVQIDPRFSSAPLTFAGLHPVLTGAYLNLPAAALVLAATVLLALGIRSSVTVNNIMVAIKLLVIALVILFGAAYVSTDNWQPFIPENTGVAGQYGWTGIVRGAGVVFFAYLGFDTVSTAAQEARNPQRDVPLGILASLLICTALYIAMALVLTGLAPYGTLGVPHPVFVAIESVGAELRWLQPVVTIGAMAGLASVVLILLLGQSRIFYAMANDGLLPAAFARVHARFQTPFTGTCIVGGSAALLAALFPIGLLGELVSIGTLFAFCAVCGGVLLLRAREPSQPRAFRVPALWVVAPFGIAICLYLMLSLPGGTWARFSVWLVAGIVIYACFGLRHSLLNRSDVSVNAGQLVSGLDTDR